MVAQLREPALIFFIKVEQLWCLGDIKLLTALSIWLSNHVIYLAGCNFLSNRSSFTQEHIKSTETQRSLDRKLFVKLTMERNPVKQTRYTLKEEAKLMRILSEIHTQKKEKRLPMIAADKSWRMTWRNKDNREITSIIVTNLMEEPLAAGKAEVSWLHSHDLTAAFNNSVCLQWEDGVFISCRCHGSFMYLLYVCMYACMIACMYVCTYVCVVYWLTTSFLYGYCLFRL